MQRSAVLLLACLPLAVSFSPHPVHGQSTGFPSARNMSTALRTQAQSNFRASQAANSLEARRRRYIQNRERATNAYFEMRSLRNAATSKPVGPEVTREKFIAYARTRAPERLKDDELNLVTGEIHWPAVLESAELTPDRTLLESVFEERAVSGGNVDFGGIQTVDRTVRHMEDDLRRRIDVLTANQYTEAKKFLRGLSYEIHSPRALDSTSEQNPTDRGLDDLIQQLGDGSPQTRARAALQIGALEGRAVSAVNALSQLLADKDPDVQRAAVTALDRINPPHDVLIPLISAALAQADPGVAAIAARSMAGVGPAAVPFLVNSLEDPQGRYWAVIALSDLGPRAAEAVPALIAALDRAQDEPGLRRELVLCLAQMGAAARGAVSRLTQELDDPDPAIAGTATFAIGRIGFGPPAAVSEFRRNLRAEDDLLRVVSAWALEKVSPKDGQQTRDVVSMLADGMVDRSVNVRVFSARAVIDLAPDTELLLAQVDSALERAAVDDYEDLLTAIATVGKPAVPWLTEILQAKPARRNAIYVLGLIGPDAGPAIPAIIEASADDDEATQQEALRAITRMGCAAVDAVPVLIDMLASESELLRLSAECALGTIGGPASDAVPALRQRVRGNAVEDTTCCWALAQIAPQDPVNARLAVPVLVASLNTEEPSVRIEVAQALARFGGRAAAATDALKQLLDDEDIRVRDAAQAAISSIGG